MTPEESHLVGAPRRKSPRKALRLLNVESLYMKSIVT
jgi:hypothetical protein